MRIKKSYIRYLKPYISTYKIWASSPIAIGFGFDTPSLIQPTQQIFPTNINHPTQLPETEIHNQPDDFINNKNNWVISLAMKVSKAIEIHVGNEEIVAISCLSNNLLNVYSCCRHRCQRIKKKEKEGIRS